MPSVPELVELFIDGASRGNPGPASIGVVLRHPEQSAPACTLYKYIGETTNNIAEYAALIYGLQEALMRGYRAVHIKTDSELVAKQLQGEYKVRDARLQFWYDQYQHLKQGFARLEITAIPREQNREADRLANEAFAHRLDRSVHSQ